jgi:gas vesicle protein
LVDYKQEIFTFKTNKIMASTKNVLLGLLTGVAVGAVLGVLFAPDKGTETRKKLAKSGSDFKDKLTEWGKNGMEKFEDIKDEAKSYADKGRNKADELKKDARTA